MRKVSPAKLSGYTRFNASNISKAPIRTIDFSDSKDKSRHDQMVGLVEHMLALHEQLAVAKITQEKTVIQRQIEPTDKQIDRIVYELYGLTDEEIRIVEEGAR